MKWKFGKSYKLFYFQVTESPAPLNVPTPTLAPDRGGPIACVGGPVFVRTVFLGFIVDYLLQDANALTNVVSIFKARSLREEGHNLVTI